VFRLALERTFEEVAELLWLGRFPEPEAWPSDPAAVEEVARVQGSLPEQVLPLDRLRVGVATAGALDPLRYGTGETAVAVTGRRLLATLVDSLPRVGPSPGPLRVRPGRPLSGSLVARLWSALAGSRAPRGGLEALNAALVLVADHELSVSTVAARMAASIAADPTRWSAWD
jgi:citrate synthase